MDWSLEIIFKGTEFDSFERIQGKSILGCVLLGSTASGWLGRLEFFVLYLGQTVLSWFS